VRARAPRTPARPQELSDALLLADVASENVSALGVLFDRHHEQVERVLARAGGVAGFEIDDLVQQTFLEVLRIASTFDGRESAGAWLCGVALRLAARRRRSIARWLRMLTAFGRQRLDDDTLHPERVAVGRQELKRFADALRQLQPKKREAFALVELEGFTAEEAGRALSVNAATMRTRLFHARRELRDAMRVTKRGLP
jgi:RNA polymerase sigma-70 factor (ECF subfamily)